MCLVARCLLIMMMGMNDATARRGRVIPSASWRLLVLLGIADVLEMFVSPAATGGIDRYPTEFVPLEEYWISYCRDRVAHYSWATIEI